MAVHAIQTLTLAGNAVAAETVTVGGKVYTFAASIAATDGLVVVGASAAASIQNLFDAINLTPSALGVTVGVNTVLNSQVRALSLTATTLVVQAKVGGTIGNLIVSTEAMTQGSWGAGVLAGGTGDTVAEIALMQPNAAIAQAIFGS